MNLMSEVEQSYLVPEPMTRAADAAASAPSKFGLRTSGRNDPPGVSGFPHSAGTAASKAHPQSLGTITIMVAFT
jgi:hypothetical protein